MILANLTQAIRQQNWFAVTIEFVIVVFAVLLAFQITVWSEESQDRQLEREYLQRLLVEVEASIEDNNGASVWDDRRIQTQELVLRSLRSGNLETIDRPDFDDGLFHLGSINPLRFRWATVEELKSTGNMNVIRDVELRRLIGQTETDYLRLSRIIERRYDLIGGYLHQIAAYYEEIEFVDPDNVIVLEYEFEALANDSEFRGLVSSVHASSVLIRRVKSDHMGNLLNLRDALAIQLDLEEAPS